MKQLHIEIICCVDEAIAQEFDNSTTFVLEGVEHTTYGAYKGKNSDGDLDAIIIHAATDSDDGVEQTPLSEIVDNFTDVELSALLKECKTLVEVS